MSAKRILNKLAPNVSNSILKNLYFCPFDSLAVVSLPAVIRKPASLKDLTAYRYLPFLWLNLSMWLIVLELRIILRIYAFASSAVNPYGIKTILANVLITTFINNKRIFINGPRSLSRNPPNCMFLEMCVLNSFILAYELFAKDLQRLIDLSIG